VKRVLIIDGYNVLRKVKRFDRHLDLSLEAGRAHFIGAVESYRSRNRSFDEVVIVFDGKEGIGPSREVCRCNVRASFSRGGSSADDHIRNLLSRHAKSCRITVVSDDNYVRNSARAYGADVMACAAFATHIAGKRTRADASDSERGLAPHEIDEINAAMRRAWRI
jgi:predicted RNA-binding protein with PIN domain